MIQKLKTSSMEWRVERFPLSSVCLSFSHVLMSCWKCEPHSLKVCYSPFLTKFCAFSNKNSLKWHVFLLADSWQCMYMFALLAVERELAAILEASEREQIWASISWNSYPWLMQLPFWLCTLYDWGFWTVWSQKVFLSLNFISRLVWNYVPDLLFLFPWYNNNVYIDVVYSTFA